MSAGWGSAAAAAVGGDKINVDVVPGDRVHRIYLAIKLCQQSRDLVADYLLIAGQSGFFLGEEMATSTVLKRIFFLNESESRILFVIQKISESESESYS